ncbi:uncharacterized protein LOC109839935 [Asparagus officinalis]|uniref:uncharacterized protein LOC109839935 n=1 Tax=Asparagus officinalis TaxID=4686 RepID=UPI00098DF0B7|nr:uncharacterized protein LOC109839935 [Asparagus officinalis]
MDFGQNPHERAAPQRGEKSKRRKGENSKEMPPVLILNKTDDLVNRVEKALQKEENARYKRIRMYLHQPDSEKYKVSNLPARKIQIGNWQRTTDKDDDLVVKFFFRMKLLAWEIHEGGLTKKIEMRWKDVSALRATCSEGHPSILNVELENPPNFFVEDDPQPRRHRKWIEIPDFTNGEAQRCRIHTLTIPEGILKEHYDKLIHNDGLLFCMNGWSFPIKNSPFSNPTQSQASSSSSFITSSAVHKSLMNTGRNSLIPGSNFHSTNANAQMNSRMGAYSTPASNGYPRRVLCIPGSNFNCSSLSEVAGGIQTSRGICRASIDENAQSHMSMMTMPSQSVNNPHPTNANGQMNSGLNYRSFTTNVNAQEPGPFVRESSMITNKELC